MPKVLQRGTAMLALLMASLVFATSALAQMPTSPWKKGAPFPEPDEELYGVAVNGKMYVIGGWGNGKARASTTSTTRPVTGGRRSSPCLGRRTMRRSRRRMEDLRLRRVCRPRHHRDPGRRRVGTHRQRLGVDPATDAWKALPPLPGKRGSAIAAEVGGKIYVIGGATTMEGSKDPFFTAFGPARVLGTNQMYDPATNKWESRNAMSVPRNHAFSGVVNGKIYVIGGRTGHGFILSATNTDVVEQYNPASDMWSIPKERMPTARSGGVSGTDGRRIYVAGGEVTTTELVGAFRAVEGVRPGDELVDDAALHDDAASRRRRRGDGNRFHLVSGMIQSAGALTSSTRRSPPTPRRTTSSSCS